MAAKVEEMKQLQIDIIKYVEKERQESGMGLERSPSPGTHTHNPLHKKCATTEQLDRVERGVLNGVERGQEKQDHHGGGTREGGEQNSVNRTPRGEAQVG